MNKQSNACTENDHKWATFYEKDPHKAKESGYTKKHYEHYKQKSHSTSLISFAKKYEHSFHRIERIINISSKEMVSSDTNERLPPLRLNSTVPIRDPTKYTTEVPDSLTVLTENIATVQHWLAENFNQIENHPCTERLKSVFVQINAHQINSLHEIEDEWTAVQVIEHKLLGMSVSADQKMKAIIVYMKKKNAKKACAKKTSE